MQNRILLKIAKLLHMGIPVHIRAYMQWKIVQIRIWGSVPAKIKNTYLMLRIQIHERVVM